MLGKVKWFDIGRRIGVIETEQGAEVNFNQIAVENAGRISLRPKQLVEFEIKKGPKGQEATNLHVLS